MPSLTHAELAELKAHHLACSHLIKGCQDATIRLRNGEVDQGKHDPHQADVEFRAVEILEHILDSWCETLSILRANLKESTYGSIPVWRTPATGPNGFARDFTGSPEHVAGRSGV